MQRRRLWSLTTIAAVLAGATAIPVIPVHAADPVTPGQSLADVPLGMPISEVVARFGAPTQIRLVDQNGTLAYVFGPYGITAYTRSNAVIAMSTTNSVVGTVRGVGLGSPVAAVVAAFGPARTIGVVEGYRALIYEGAGIAFGLDQQAVAAVMVFQPIAGAAPASPPSAPASPSPAPSVGALSPPGTPGVQPAGLPSVPASAIVAAPSTAPPGSTAAAPAMPDVSRLRPFSAETRYMSLAGYLRYLIYRTTSTWVDHTSVNSQDGARLIPQATSGQASP